MKLGMWIAIVVIVFAALVLLTQVLWNMLLPELFGFPTISFWQAGGLMALGQLLFTSPHLRK